MVIYVDNKSAIEYLTKNPVLEGRSKHIHICFHFIKYCIERREIVVRFLCAKENRK